MHGNHALKPKLSRAQTWARPLVQFLHIESASGIVLLFCTLVALCLANSPWKGGYEAFWHTPIVLGVGSFKLDKSLEHWINDGLMTLFFFVVGLEIKRELVLGELREARKAALPVIAAIGGMLAPAAIYLALQLRQPGQRGWGIPMATDIAFVVGFLALLGQRVPIGLKILLLTLAIADDIGAIVVIAVFYTENLALSWLGLGMAGLVLTIACNFVGVRWRAVYLLLGAVIWLAFLMSGVHPTVAGVLLGLLTPIAAWYSATEIAEMLAGILQAPDGTPASERLTADELRVLSYSAREAVSPLDSLEHYLHPWVAFLIMPAFALANAGVHLDLGSLGSPVSLAVAAGLVLGKPLGIFCLSWVAVRLGLAKLPSGVDWKVMLGAGCLAGIGFTMSLFIATLALPEALLPAGKIGTLMGSLLSALIGCGLLIVFLPRKLGPTAREV